MNNTGQGSKTSLAGTLFNWGLRAFLLVSIVCIFVPFWPALPQGDSEASWAFGLNQAVAQGLVFGREILYTLGPYAAIYTRTYHPATDHLMLFGSLYLSFLFGMTLLFLTSNSRWYLLLALCLVLLGFVFARDPLFYCYPLLAGLYCYTLLQRSDAVRVNDRWGTLLLLACFSPFGLLPLVKGSYLVLCGSIAVLAVLVTALYRKWAWAAAIMVSTSCSLTLFWAMAGQPLSALPGYLGGMVPVIAGYSDAMFKYGAAREVACYLVASTVLLGTLMWGRGGSPALRLYLFAMFFVTLFIAFKGGFVRHDGHAVAAGTSLVLTALVFVLVFPSRRALASLAVCTAAWIYIDSYTRSAPLESTLDRIVTTFTKTIEGVERRGGANSRLDRAFKRRLAQLRGQSGIPQFAGTSDIYSVSQSYLIASGTTWNPRPVFQSYAAYTPALAALNRDHLLGDDAPDNLFFKVEPIDRRLPAIEDGPSWPVMLARYRPGKLEHGYLYLHRGSGGAPPGRAAQALPGGGSYAFGQEIAVPGGEADLVFAEIVLDKSLPGVLAGVLYKPGEVEITLTLVNGIRRVYRLVPAMAKAGFLLSPLVESTVQFARLYGSLSDLSDKHVQSFSLAPAGDGYQWQRTFEVAFTAVPPPPRVDLAALHAFAAPAGSHAVDALPFAEHCEGNIDAVNGTSPAPGRFHATGVLEVDGWLAVSASDGVLPDRVLVVLENGNGTRRLFETGRTQHPWAGKHFDDPAMEMAGFTTVVDTSGLSGDYTLGLALVEGGRISVCREFAIPGSFRGTSP